MENELFLNELCRIAQKAGVAIMEHYGQAIEVTRKDDRSPVTIADMAAHHIIQDGLRQMDHSITLISEEDKTHEIPAGAKRFWLVDPLDGTKSFIRGTGEFTVNIALVEGVMPTIGVIYLPVQRALYWASPQGAWRQMGHGPVEVIRVATPPAEGLRAVVSHSHIDPETKRFLDDFPIMSEVSAASSLKFCRVAEGAADIYPRFGPTMEWDTAAGQAIVQGAGGRVETPDGQPFTYRKAGLRNGAFVAYGG